MDKSAFVSGFLSLAKEAEILTPDTYQQLQKQASESFYAAARCVLMEKQSSLGLGLTTGGDIAGSVLGTLVAANALGAGVGGNYAPLNTKELEEEMAYSEDPGVGKYLKYLIPGYAGYRAAKNNRLEQAYQNYRDNQRSKNMPAAKAQTTPALPEAAR